MKIITSADNQIYKMAVQLKQKKYRDQMGKYIIEGPNLIEEAINNKSEIEIIIQSSELSEKENSEAELNKYISNLPEGRFVKMSEGIFRKLSDTENPQGIMAVVKKKNCSEEEFFSGKKNRGTNIVVLDRLQDPGNIGTILRTADAAGYLGALILKGTADIYSPKIVRATAGSLFRLPVLMVDSPEYALELLKKNSKKIICTTPNCDSYYYDVDMKENVAVIIGNEGNGACHEFLIKSDIKIKIPMEGSIESLNAAVSAGILMYESVRQRFQR